MIPKKTRDLIHVLANDHVKLCKIKQLPDYAVHREIKIIATVSCINAGVRPSQRAKKFVDLLADRYVPVSKSKLIVPGGQQ